MIEVDELWNSFDSDTICFVEWLLIHWWLSVGSLGDVPRGSLHGVVLLPAISTMQSAVVLSRVLSRMGSLSVEIVGWVGLNTVAFGP